MKHGPGGAGYVLTMQTIRASQFDADHDLPDWRYILGTIDATFRLGSFPGATAFAAAVAEAAEAADHHPDIDVRYPDIARVRLVTHAAGGITELDMSLARTISDIAAASGATSEPAIAAACEIAIDAMDIGAIRPFWREAFGYVEERDDALVDPRRLGPAIWFQQMDEPRTQRNNIHLDIVVTHDVGEERVAAVIDAGGRLLSDRRAPAFWVLADPEGNEACICTWQNRD